MARNHSVPDLATLAYEDYLLQPGLFHVPSETETRPTQDNSISSCVDGDASFKVKSAHAVMRMQL